MQCDSVFRIYGSPTEVKFSVKDSNEGMTFWLQRITIESI